MRKHLALLSVLGLFSLAIPAPANAALVRLSFEEITQRSKLILTGEVIELRSYWAPAPGGGECLFTDVKLRVENLLKGKPESDGAEVIVQILGGQLGDIWQKCLESPRYTQGEKVLVFLQERQGKLWNTGWLQGKYPLAAGGSVVSGKSFLPIAAEVPLATVREHVRLYSPSETTVEESRPASATSAQGAASQEGGKR